MKNNPIEVIDIDDDIEEDIVVKKPLIHFNFVSDGVQLDQSPLSRQSYFAEGTNFGIDEANVFGSNEYMQFDKSPSNVAREALLAEFERRRKARSLFLPTDDGEIQSMLRLLNEPICLFGEEKPERHERLRMLMSLMTEDERMQLFGSRERVTQLRREDQLLTWYHEGPASLRESRIFIAKYSWPRAQSRLQNARIMQNLPSQEKSVRFQETHKWIRSIGSYCSQFVDSRPISFCQFSPDSSYLASASWSGLCKLWSIPDCNLIRTFRGHNANVGCIAWHPKACLSLESHLLNLASCAHDGSVKLWNLDNEEPLGELEGHAPYRVSRVAFHPSGRFLATCCFDNSWRLFDIEQDEEVLFQEGHSKPVYDIAFQCDGAIAVTGGLDSYGRAWDLRTGKCIMFLEGHLKGILSVDFALNGYQMASGGQDNCCKIWDLRMRRCIYTIAAHQSLVSKLVFDKRAGDYLISCSYDNTVKLWTHPGWHPLKTLQGHENKVMCVDISANGKWIASSSFDRTFKLWAPEAAANVGIGSEIHHSDNN